MAKSSAALAAQMIRKEIKAAFPGVNFTCRSENYSGGNSVDVNMIDQPREIYDAIKKITGKYQMGHFDGMVDCYEYSNSRDDIPQVKFVFCRNDISPAKRQEVYSGIRQYWQGGNELPESYEAGQNIWFQNCYISEFVWREFNREAA